MARRPDPGHLRRAEPFTTTVTITLYAAIVISLPVILNQAYAHMLPALIDRERRVIVPFLVMVPVLFCAGVVFGYFVVLPAATKFLLNFNESQFNIQIRAKEYYSFFIMRLGAMGLVFQLPIGVLAVSRLGSSLPSSSPRTAPAGTRPRGRGGRGRPLSVRGRDRGRRLSLARERRQVAGDARELVRQ